MTAWDYFDRHPLLAALWWGCVFLTIWSGVTFRIHGRKGGGS